MSPVADELPSDRHARRSLLDEYFPRRLAEANMRDDGRWEITVRPFDEPEMHVDPHLTEGLQWWDPALNLEDIPIAVRRVGESQISLEDAWTASAISRWLERHPDERLTVLHIDDHTDLMEPLLARSTGRGGWVDLLTDVRVDLWRPESVERSVTSGAIGVAGFFTPFIHDVALGEIRHLCHGRHAATRAGRFRLVPRPVPDRLLLPGALRPGVELRAETSQSSGWTYQAHADIDEWLAEPIPGPALLHVDFDYFCNRFDGDSDWQQHQGDNDVSGVEVSSRVDALVTAIDRAGVAEQLEVVCGALSPGFFPAELWASTVERLAAGLATLGVDVRAWRQ